MTTNFRFLQACRREPTDRTPVWFMRQAGRYMPEYRAIRARHSFLEMVKTPELAAEITLQPLRALPVDATIIYSDILPPLEGMGLRLTYEQGEGPVIHNPLCSLAEIEALAQPDPRETVAYTLDAIRLVKRELAGKLPLIGFCGAPFTLASYAIEGGGSREYRRTKQLMYREPAAWHTLMGKLATLVSDYALAQIAAGADAIQLFDSWAGALAPADYAEFVLPYVQQVVAAIRQRTTDHRTPTTDALQTQSSAANPRSSPPISYFGTDTCGRLGLLRQTGADVLGVDWRVPLDDAWAQIGPGYAIQGNLDPHTLFAPWPVLERRAADILERAAGRPGHIFNLGHGILTETPVEAVARLAEFVSAYSQSTVAR
ncbi:MAG: uroporphyrinogen decarboxylase [Candidatus Accumulibacter sp.]|uniref:uroporphyrinogen decarboxylase n=1 Tax=Accumulibacter sp. TaxID=2053492 RepID=UPI001B1CDC85|nr:uroporphyrinogen decarboxylase [Accumulibacter sp.]MBO3702900.1 uroporphyrinogen decarboxylase [Accumulibacter sp.]